ncbi:MAG: HD domain-containing protein [Candidatus Dojkabacteria bacterium]
MDSKTRKEIEKYVKSKRWTPLDYYWKHAFQVRDFALLLAKDLGGDTEVIEASALLHDIGKSELLAPGHEEISSRLAKELLGNIVFDSTKIPLVQECIEYEDFKTLESRILRTADSMALIMDTEGQKWYFENILRNDKEKILEEVRKSYEDIEFDLAKDIVIENYNRLIEKYS